MLWHRGNIVMAADDDDGVVSVWVSAITTTFCCFHSFGSCQLVYCRVKMIFGMMLGWVVCLCLCLLTFSAAAQRISAPTTNNNVMHHSINIIPKELLTGVYTLVDLNVNSLKQDGTYSAQATFCRVDWTVHQANPSLVSFFDDLRNHSCKEEVEVDLLDFVKAARRLDATTAAAAAVFVPRVGSTNAAAAASTSATAVATNIRPTGVVFHESRCGSTLAANMLAAFDPPSTRVYSEHFPAIDALRACAGQDESSCPSATHQQLIQDVFFTLGRVPADSPVQQVFFKTNSGGMFISHFTRAFPDTPWIYMYRDSQEIMQSHFKISEREILDSNNINDKNQTFDVPCARNQKKEIQPPATLKVLHRHNITNVSTLSMTEYCAAHLAGITHSVLTEHYRQASLHNKTGAGSGIKTTTSTATTPKGRFVNYKQMPAIMYESIVPHHFGIPLTPDMTKRMQAVTNMYSKGGKRKSSDVSATWTSPPATPLPAPHATTTAAASFLQAGQQPQQQQPSPHGATTLPARPAVPIDIVAAVARYCPDTYAQLEAVRIRQEQEAETNLILLRKQQAAGPPPPTDADSDADDENKARSVMGWVELLTFTAQVFFCFEYLKKETLYEFVATKWHCMRLKAVSYWF
jgi:hypothetical protein